MKVFYHNSFEGHYPVGTAAIVVAANADDAVNYLEDKLSDIGLHQEINKEDLVEIETLIPSVSILNDGDY